MVGRLYSEPMNAAKKTAEIDSKTVKMAQGFVDAAHAKYKGMWQFVTVDVRRDLALAQAAVWCSQQDDQTLPLSRITPAIDRVLTMPEWTV